MLFFSPDFWGHFAHSKHSLCHLRETCKEFHSTIPERDAVLCIFRGKTARKVDLFRLFPLTVHDVLKLRSPVDFTTAFRIAERKTGGFSNCMAIVRERGWRLWLSLGVKRAELRQRFERVLMAEGIPMPSLNPVFELAIQRSMQRLVVWRYRCCFEGWMPWERYNPNAAGHSRAVSSLMYKRHEYNLLLKTLRHAMGYWYKGIHKDVQSAVAAIRGVKRNAFCKEHIHVTISNKALLVGQIVFHPWQPPPV